MSTKKESTSNTRCVTSKLLSAQFHKSQPYFQDIHNKYTEQVKFNLQNNIVDFQLHNSEIYEVLNNGFLPSEMQCSKIVASFTRQVCH